jgi:hypothetical protein
VELSPTLERTVRADGLCEEQVPGIGRTHAQWLLLAIVLLSEDAAIFWKTSELYGLLDYLW